MAYFILTLIFTLQITLILPLLFSTIFSIIIDYVPFGESILLHYAYIAIPLIFCFLIMCGYGYAIIKAKHPRKPLSRMGLYVPLFVPLIWYLLNVGICNVTGIPDDFGRLFLDFRSFHIFGWVFDGGIFGLDAWHSTLLGNLIYDAVLILGFAVGERLSAQKTGVERKPLAYHKKVIMTVIIVVVVSAYAMSEFVLFKQRENIIESAHPYPSYRFSYAGGYSSIDLHPYSVENEENILAKLEEAAAFHIDDPQEMPIMDGAEAAYPVYSAFANACYTNISEIQGKANKPNSEAVMPIQFTNTIYAYEKLLSGEIDIFFGARPSEAQVKMAEEAGVELELTPIGKEAFVFFVNEENPVDNLSSEQLRDIYSGQINNWRNVGGANKKILAFQRPENSGSQTMMEYFMGDKPLREPLQTEYVSTMSGVVRETANYENSASSLGYSFRYYTTIMMADSGEEVAGIKLLAVDGVYPDTETIQSGEYPYTTQLYAITVGNRSDAKSTIKPFLEWMVGPQGQQIVSDTGYVAIK